LTENTEDTEAFLTLNLQRTPKTLKGFFNTERTEGTEKTEGDFLKTWNLRDEDG